uniref:Uncharacterized protein n=1 Tax=Knipowitschia caucasica TaxID=637954 RepID=A0AAV2JHU9_KNICA
MGRGTCEEMTRWPPITRRGADPGRRLTGPGDTSEARLTTHIRRRRHKDEELAPGQVSGPTRTGSGLDKSTARFHCVLEDGCVRDATFVPSLKVQRAVTFTVCQYTKEPA